MSPYPKAWITANLFEVCQPRQWKTISTKDLNHTGYTVYGANGVIGFYNEYTHEAPTLMITCRGATCGNLHISKPFSYINGNAMALDSVNETVCTIAHLHRFLQARGFDDVISGSAQPQITREGLRKVEVPIAPLNEQKRIADKLDTVLTRVDAVNTRLARVAPLLKRFRQSVLAAATSGRLTEDWRSLDASSTPWRQTTLGDLIDEMRNGLATKPDENPGGQKILRISAVRPGVLDTADHRYLTTDESEARLYGLRKGDLLYTRYNGSLDYVGVCAMVSEDLPEYVYPDKLIRVRAKAAVVLPKYVEIASSAAEARAQIEGYVKSSAGQKGISGGNLKALRIAVPAINEQTEIVRRVETLFAFADRLEARLQTAQAAANRLTPSLLAKAFRGELVPQDPNDEPASELLKRLAMSTPAVTKRPRRTRAPFADHE